jgi:hypothetical protein
MSEIAYRWLNGPDATDAEWDRIEQILIARGWMSLNRLASRILIAEDTDGALLGFFVCQYVIHTEPLWVVPSRRGGEIAEQLADQMLGYMMEIQARGWMLIANDPVAAKMAEARGMVREESPVYVAK